VKMSSDLDFFMFPKRVYVAGIPKTKPTNKVEKKLERERMEITTALNERIDISR